MSAPPAPVPVAPTQQLSVDDAINRELRSVPPDLKEHFQPKWFLGLKKLYGNLPQRVNGFDEADMPGIIADTARPLMVAAATAVRDYKTQRQPSPDLFHDLDTQVFFPLRLEKDEVRPLLLATADVLNEGVRYEGIRPTGSDPAAPPTSYNGLESDTKARVLEKFESRMRQFTGPASIGELK